MTYPLPYTHQQVGKPISTIPTMKTTTIPTTPTTVLPVPQQVLEKKILTTTLTPGDVLYIPRGYVHCAYCPIISSRTDTTTRTMTMGNNSTSFHVTLAIPTHDWTLAGLMSELIPTFLLDSPIISPPQSQLSSLLRQEQQYKQELQEQQHEQQQEQQHNEEEEEEENKQNFHKLALSFFPFGQEWKIVPKDLQNMLQSYMNQIWIHLHHIITPCMIHNVLQQKYQIHNQRSKQQRQFLLQQYNLLLQQEQQQQEQQQQEQPWSLLWSSHNDKNKNNNNDSTRTNSTSHSNNSNNKNKWAMVVGREAARTLTPQTRLRLATDEEKQWARVQQQQLATTTTIIQKDDGNNRKQEQQHKRPRLSFSSWQDDDNNDNKNYGSSSSSTPTVVGLRVRECIAHDITHVLEQIKKRTTTSTNTYYSKNYDDHDSSCSCSSLLFCFQVQELYHLLWRSSSSNQQPDDRLCIMTLLCLAKQCVTLGTWAIHD